MPPTEEEIGQLFDLHNSPQRRQELLWRSYGFDPSRQWVGEGGYSLSDNVWRARKNVRTQIDDMIRQAIANGTDPLELADMVEQFLDPSLTPVRNANGKLIRNQRKGIVTAAPGRGGMGSFSARRLARTEITRAHGQATIEVAKRTPFAKGVKWSISGSHPKDDPCDINATQNNHNLGPGVYPTDQVPRYPHHPMCLCVLSTVTPDDIDGVVNSLRDQYELGDAVETEQVSDTGTPVVIPELKTKADIHKFIESLGTTIRGDVGQVNNARVIAEGLAREVQAGNALPPTIQFASGNGVAAYSRIGDPRSNGFTGHRLKFYPSDPIWTKIESESTRAYKLKWWSTPDPEHVFRHEMGHYLHDQKAPAPSKRAAETFVYKGVKQTTTWKDPRHKSIALRVSEYGSINPKEFVAETYAGLRYGMEYDEEIMDLYRLFGGPDV
jgi:hypothetical protein